MTKLYGGELSREVAAQTDIVDVIGESIRLSRKGNKYWGLCPFHGEKTPSFCVNQEKQMFYCFGCHIGGDVYSFLMKSQGLSFRQALEMLAERVGIKIPKYESQSEDNEYRSLLNLHKTAAEYYRNFLLDSSAGKQAREYLNRRGLDEAICEKFYLGYAGEAWDGLTKHLLSRGFSAEILLKSGLVRAGTAQGSLYDFLKKRIIFPILQYAGEYIAFGGRTIASDQQPKYLNSPETLLYSKRKSLYGLLQAREAIRKQNAVLLVEGYMDCVKMHQYGLSHTVASLGTAFTEEQAALLHRYAEKAVVVYDGDSAGQNQTWRALEILQKEGMTAAALTLAEGLDPDDFLSRFGAEGFQRYMQAHQESALDFKLRQMLANGEKLDSSRQVKIIRELHADWVGLTSEIEKEAYADSLARRLHLPEHVVKKELARLSLTVQTNRIKRNNPTEKWDNNTKDRYPIVDRVMAYILKNKELFTRVKTEIGLEIFGDEEYRKLLKLYDETLLSDPGFELEKLRVNAIELGLGGTWAKLMMIEKDEADLVYVTDFIAQVKNLRLTKSWEALLKEVAALGQGDYESIARLLYKINHQLAVTREGEIK